MTGAYPDNLREQHIDKFESASGENEVIIMYKGQTMVRMYDVDGLPKGFQYRFLTMITELLQGKRTELWDSQVIFGEVVKPTKEQLTQLRDYFNSARRDEE